MTARFLVVLLLVTCFISALACGGTREEPVNTQDNSIDEIAEMLFAPANEIEKKILAAEDLGSVDPYDPPEENPVDPVEGGEEIAGYPFPSASSSMFTPSGNDPLTGNSWDDLTGVIQTNKGTVKIKFFHDPAPRHVENFVYLARNGFYDGLLFHRYVEGFVIQGGDPDGTGEGGPGYTIPAEFNPGKHVVGAVAAARRSDDVNPTQRSSGSQFYIMVGDAPHLDGNYTVWGEVVEGMDIVMELREGDLMEKIVIE